MGKTDQNVCPRCGMKGITDESSCPNCNTTVPSTRKGPTCGYVLGILIGGGLGLIGGFSGQSYLAYIGIAAAIFLCVIVSVTSTIKERA